jgi:ribosomal protein L37AE/L43A
MSEHIDPVQLHCPECMVCGEEFALDRWSIGYKTCMPCGEAASKHAVRTIANISKSNYMLITDAEMLKQLNPKRIGD